MVLFVGLGKVPGDLREFHPSCLIYLLGESSGRRTAGGRLGAGKVPTVAAGAKVESKPPLHCTFMVTSMSVSVGRMDAGTS